MTSGSLPRENESIGRIQLYKMVPLVTLVTNSLCTRKVTHLPPAAAASMTSRKFFYMASSPKLRWLLLKSSMLRILCGLGTTLGDHSLVENTNFSRKTDLDFSVSSMNSCIESIYINYETIEQLGE